MFQTMLLQLSLFEKVSSFNLINVPYIKYVLNCFLLLNTLFIEWQKVDYNELIPFHKVSNVMLSILESLLVSQCGISAS